MVALSVRWSVQNRWAFVKLIDSYLNHQIEVVAIGTKFELDNAEKRMHIVEGLIKALSILDKVIGLIRSSKTSVTLMKRRTKTERTKVSTLVTVCITG